MTTGLERLSVEEQMLEYERLARQEAERRAAAEREAALRAARAREEAAARAREESAARMAAQLEADRQARLDAARRAAEAQAAAQRRAAEAAAAREREVAAARAREEAANRIAAQESSRQAQLEADRRAAAERAAAAAREAEARTARAREEAAARAREEAAAGAREEAAARIEASSTPKRGPRLSEILAGTAPSDSAPRPSAPDPVTRASAPDPVTRASAPGGLEIAADAIQAGADLRARNDALRRAFDAVPGGPEARAQIEALVESSRRPSSRATDLVEERSRDLENRAIASTLPMGEEAYDLFKRERELDDQTAAMQRELLLEREQPDYVAPSLGRAALRSTGSEPVSDFEAYASFLEEGRRERNAADAVARARGAATASRVADDLEAQSALDAALRREMLADPGGADVVREMDARAADVEAAQQREMLADPGGLGVLRPREAAANLAISAPPDAEAPVVAYRTVTYDLFAEDLGGEDGWVKKAFDFGHAYFDATPTGLLLKLFGIDDLSFGTIPGLPTYELFTHRVVVTQLRDAEGNIRTEVTQGALNEEAGWTLKGRWQTDTNGAPTEHRLYAHYDVEGLSPFESSTADVAITVIESEGDGVPRFEQTITWEGVLRPEMLKALEIASNSLPPGALMSEIAERAGYPKLGALLDQVPQASVWRGVIRFAYDQYVEADPGLSAKPRPLQVSPWVTLPEEMAP